MTEKPAEPEPPRERSERKPIGWQCEHMSTTSAFGTMTKPEPLCGCEMQPIY